MTEESAEENANETEDTKGSDYISGRKFVDFSLSQEVLQGIVDHGYTSATPIQSATLEIALAGKDIVARAKTGTGKTAAFAIPICELIDPAAPSPQAVILAPTRELAQQISQECETFSVHKGVKTALLVGGMPINPQIKALNNGADIVVGTPGRVMDHIKKGHLAAENVRISCLDEADEMLSMGFVEDVRAIMRKFPKNTQTLLFSATVSKDTEALVSEFLNEPEQIYLSTDLDNVETIQHVIYEAPHQLHKAKALLYLIDIEQPDNAIIFCNTRADASTVASFLDKQGLDAHLLSGEMAQSQRSRVMKRIKSGKVKYLVATDVASRGIDISNLTHVINYMLPSDPKTYLHRIGRTGRLGKMGTAISLMSGSDLNAKKVLSTKHAIDFKERPFPSEEECIRNRVAEQAQQIQRAMGTIVFESYLPTVDGILELENGKALLASALRAFFQWDRQRRAAVVDVEEPRPSKSDRGGNNDRDRDRNRKKRPAKDGKRDSQATRSRDDRKGGPKKHDKRDNRRKPKNNRDKQSAKAPQRSENKSPKQNIDDLDSLLSFD